MDIIQRQLDWVLRFSLRVQARIATFYSVKTLNLVTTALNLSAGDLRLRYISQN